jgi:hypothetical protein
LRNGPRPRFSVLIGALHLIDSPQIGAFPTALPVEATTVPTGGTE